MRYLMIAVVAAAVSGPLIGCHEQADGDRNPLTGRPMTTDEAGGK